MTGRGSGSSLREVEMEMCFRILIASLSLLVLAACSDAGEADTGTGGSGGNGTGAASGTGTGGEGSGSQCTTSTTGCECVELAPGGVKVCVQTPVEATRCSAGEGAADECCSSVDCASGKCFPTPIAPACSGERIGVYNVCAADQCSADADCTGGAWCLPAGALGHAVATCISSCRQDSDCTEKVGGRCVIEPTTTCCGDDLPRCRYPDTPPVGDECPP